MSPFFGEGKINMNGKTLYKIVTKNASVKPFFSVDIYYVCHALCWGVDIQW